MTISSILSTHFQIHPTKITPLQGYENLNYKIVDESGQKWIYKQYPYDEVWHGILEAEIEIVCQLSQQYPSLYPSPKIGKNGKYLQLLSNRPIGQYMGRVNRFMEGQFLIDLPRASLEVYEDFGHFLATMDTHLRTIRHAVIEARRSVWDLQYLMDNQALISYISAANRQELVRYFFAEYQEKVSPHTAQLRRSMTHNDANTRNVLIGENQEFRIIDFGDLAYTYLISELAVAIAYAILRQPNPLEIALSITKGYAQILPLEALELEVLYYMIAGRCCTSVCNSAYGSAQDPTNVYIPIEAEAMWKVLEKWRTISPQVFVKAFKKA